MMKNDKKGSILLVAILLGTGIALALGSFITLSVSSLKLSNRSLHSNSVLNLAEAAVEEGIYALNKSDWTGWSTHGSGSQNKTMSLGPFDLGHGAAGEATIVVYGATSSPSPRIVAEGMVRPSIGPPISKQIEVKLRRRSHWATGLVAKDKITFSGGNATVDSYVSDDPSYSTGGLYDASKRRDRGSAGSISVTTDAVSISNSDIWGYVATGGSLPQAGPNGTIRGTDTPAGVKIDLDRITTDFSATFDPVAAPTSFDVLATDITGNATLGSSGTTTSVRAANVSNTNGKTIEILGNVTLVVTNEVDIKGTLIVRPNSTLTIFVNGDFFAGGNGAVNQSGLPANLIIYGTATSPGGQTIKLHGNGALHGAVYAPNAAVELEGGGSSGSMSGSVVANTITITGNYAFHYDEALEKVGSGNPFAVNRWRELILAADRVSL
ncbi:MAG TPA: collagen-binding domain-containing protein [Opitutaceae bacterium]